MRRSIASKFPGPFDVVQDGLRFRLYPTSNYCDRHILSRRTLPEADEHRAVAGLVQPGSIVVDVGANIGTYSVFFARAGEGKARILALEPHPSTYRKLVFNIHANECQNVIAIPIAAGTERSTQKLWSDGGGNIGHSSLLEAGTSHAKLSVSVPTMPLLDIIREHVAAPIDILKIDVEGYEDRVIGPFFANAPKDLWPHAVLIETANRTIWENDCVALLSDRGYRSDFRTAQNTLFRRDP